MKQLLLLIACLLTPLSVLAQELATIDGLRYLLTVNQTAYIENTNTYTGELDIPEKVTYEGKDYTVKGIKWLAFDFCNTLTKVRIPKTLTEIYHYAGYKACKNPFRACTSLESIEVDEENPSMSSVDGVLFNKDKTQLYCYPAGARRENYTVPDGVTWTGGDAFAYNSYLQSVTLPNSVAEINFDIFSNCTNLKSVKLSESITYIPASSFEKCESLKFLEIPESVSGFAESVFRWSPIDTIVIRGTFPNGLRYDTFYFMDESTVIYVQASEVEKFKQVFHGTVLPLEEYHPKPIYNTFVVEGKRWNCVNIGGNPANEPTPFSYFMQGDTLIGGQVCKKMFIEGLHGDKPDYYAAFYEEDGRVYRYQKESESAELIFDYVRQAGNKGTFFGQEHEVIRIDTLESQGRKFRVLYLYNGVPNISGVTIVVDGLGGDISSMFSPGALVGGTNGLATCEQDGEVIYSAADINYYVYDEVISKWYAYWLATQVSGIRETQRTPAANDIYDLQGRRLSSVPRKGVYVRDGKKVVIK